MCGIFFVYSKQGIDADRLISIADAYVGPRGPTAKNVWSSNNALRYSSVLSINKSTTHREDIQYVGELFDLDPSCNEIEYLNRIGPFGMVDANPDGMYSIIWHKQDATFAISDPQGEKRLFYYNDGSLLIVSSVPGAIARSLPHIKVNEQSLSRYLRQRHHVATDGCIVDGIYEMSRGLWKFDPGRFTFERIQCFDYSDWKVSSDNPINALKQEISVMKDHEGSSNAMYAVSGGIDSSVVSKLRSPDHTISLKFDDKDCAAHLSSNIADAIGSKHHTLDVDVYSYADSALRCIDLMAGVMPTHAMASMHLLGKRVEQLGCSILYGGDGADELFLGYPCYHQGTTNYSSAVWGSVSPYDVEIMKHFDDYVGIKKWSVYDYFFQCGSCQFLAADIAYSDSGIEYRTPFARRRVAACGLSMPADVLLSGQLGKQPLVEYYRDSLGIEPYRKVGLAGYPNELEFIVGDVYLNEKEQELFDEAMPFFSDRDFQWKVVNYKLFKKVYGAQL